MQVRLGKRARTTKDIDMLLLSSDKDIHQLLVQATAIEAGDWFQFEVAQSARDIPAHGGGLRFQTQSLLNGKLFERFHVDIGTEDPVLEPVEYLALPPLLEFAGIAPTLVPCYPLTQHLAEKIHAYTRPRPSGESSRVKDLVDILLIAELGRIKGHVLNRATQMTFDAQGTHTLPRQLPDPPSSWAVPFSKLASEVGFGYTTLSVAGKKAHRFLDPLLQGEPIGIWDSTTWTWQS